MADAEYSIVFGVFFEFDKDVHGFDAVMHVLHINVHKKINNKRKMVRNKACLVNGLKIINKKEGIRGRTKKIKREIRQKKLFGTVVALMLSGSW